MNRFLVLLLLLTALSASTVLVSGSGGLTPSETNVLALVSGSEAYSFDLHLENIALAHPGFRAAGSAGANEAADWVATQFSSFGLMVEKEEFQFTKRARFKLKQA